MKNGYITILGSAHTLWMVAQPSWPRHTRISAAPYTPLPTVWHEVDGRVGAALSRTKRLK